MYNMANHNKEVREIIINDLKTKNPALYKKIIKGEPIDPIEM